MSFCCDEMRDESVSHIDQSLDPINVIHNLWKHWHVLAGINYSNLSTEKPRYGSSHLTAFGKTQLKINGKYHSFLLSTVFLYASSIAEQPAGRILQRKK